MTTQSYRTALFYLIRWQDVELAEDFARRCDDGTDLTQLNAFFHRILAEYSVDTQMLRRHLDASLDFPSWCQVFETYILPFLRTHRFPPLTAPDVDVLYSAQA